MDRNALSRREFLKIAGITAAGMGLAGGLTGTLSGCGEEAGPTTTGGSTATTAGETTSTTAASSTTVSASAEAGREIKLGVVTPQTGPLAVFGIADKWSAELTNKTVANGLVLGDGKKHPVTTVSRDTQSDSNRAAQVAGDLITNEKVDILLAAGAPDTVNPAADQAEALGTPFLSVFDPWSAFVFGRGGSFDKPFKWTYGHLLGLEQVCASMVDLFEKTPTNKKVAFLAMNNADGQAWLDSQTGAPPFLEAAGYTIVAPGLFTPGSEDFTAQISQFKKEGCEVLTGASTTPDFTNFWKQSLQQGFKPPVASQALALGFPQAAEAIGPTVYGLIGPDGSWHRTFPFTDSLTGMTCEQLAGDYEAATNSEYTGAIGGHAKMSWAIDVLGRTKNLDDKEAILDAIKTTKLETILGPIDMTQPVDQNPLDPLGTRPHPNVTKPVITGQQWVKGNKWPYEVVVVGNKLAPMVPAVELQPMKY
ncbi:MAG: ABC transporter substrate-binding protein [Chloroflexi bacterium]|nr:ABC transporter substrate-binding protein [Chloroflexota bacterium]MCL5734963.1 ABC transporter substrate-binding protein [Actinomycetota bacterium]